MRKFVRFGHVIIIFPAFKSFVCNGIRQYTTTCNSLIAFSSVSVSVYLPIRHSYEFLRDPSMKEMQAAILINGSEQTEDIRTSHILFIEAYRFFQSIPIIIHHVSFCQHILSHIQYLFTVFGKYLLQSLL